MATTGNPLLPQGFNGIGGALQAAAPMFLSMAQGFRQGNPYAYLDQGLAQMMAAQKEKAGETAFQEALGMPGTQPGQFSMVTGPQGTQPASPVAGAFQGAAAASGQFPQSLIRTESGGNWNALNKEGYGGRLQFGQARLADAARAGIIPAGMTGAAFSQLPPEQQQAVENWHFADIDQQAKARGLDKYIGQNIGGTTVTQDGIRAMAHLGGIGGAARFLESGGQYNPADSNSTSLGDYLRTHAGGGQARQQQAPRRDLNRLYAAYANENLSPAQRGVIGMLIEQEQARMAPADPLKQIQLETAQLQLDQMRNPAAPKPIEVGGVLLDPVTYQPIFDSRQGQGSEGFTLSPGQQRFDANGQPLAAVPAAAPEMYQQIPAADAAAMGLPPGAYQRGPDNKVYKIGGEGVTVNNNMGNADSKFAEAFAKGDADAVGTVTNAASQANRNLARVDRLESLLANGPSGAEAGIKSLLGEYGIKTEGLDTLQAAQALINTMVPEQRQPGSGPMSDADLALFKQSLPRLINSAEGNALIINTLRGIAQYDAQGGEIVQKLRSGQIDRAQAFDMLNARQNPLAGLGAQANRFEAPASASGLSGTGWQDVGGVKIRRRE